MCVGSVSTQTPYNDKAMKLTMPFYIFTLCSFLATYYLKLNESLLYRMYNSKNMVPYAEIQLESWTFQWVGLDVDGAPVVADASDQQTLQHTWPSVTMQACFNHRIKKVKTVTVTFLSHNSDFIRIVRYCKFIIVRKKGQNSEIKSQLPFTLYIP